MSLLSYNRLFSEIRGRRVIAERDGSAIPVELLNASSIDIRLGRRALVERHDDRGDQGQRIIDYRARDQLDVCAKVLDPEEGLLVYPGQFLLTESEEMFCLPNYISAEYKLKSSMARVGLEHLTAGWADAGWNNSVLTLELKNMTQHHVIRIRPGDRIGQLTFFEHEEVPRDRSYATRGRYNNDSSVSGAKRSA